MSEIEKIDKSIIRGFGNYMAQFITPPLEQVSELITDKFKYYTWNNKLNLMKKAKDKIDKLGLPIQNIIPLKLGIPLLEAASLEEDDRLQELWANLLVNSSIGFSLERSYISVLEQLSLLEAKILIQIYANLNYVRNSIYVVNATCLPKHIRITKHIKNTKEILIDTIEKEIDTIQEEDTQLALSNLARLQCIEGMGTFGGGTSYTQVITTFFGAKLYEAIKDPIN